MRDTIRHWRNVAEGGEFVFITTDVLRRVNAFSTDRLKREVLHGLAADHRNNLCALHAYVIMSTHLHFVTCLAPGLRVSEFMRRVKINSSRRLQPLLSPTAMAELAEVRGKTNRVLWETSFRSETIIGDRMFHDVVTYIHSNPVEAEMCQSPLDYAWSSAWLFEEGRWSPEHGLPLDRILNAL